jgi:predicted phage terminase large subunit-like protein
MRKVLDAIYKQVESGTDYRTFVDLRDFCRETMKTDISLGVEYLVKLSDRIEQVIPHIREIEKLKEMYQLHKSVLLLGAPHSFHLFLLYMEWNREPTKKFYPPRKKMLRQVVDALQELADGRLDLLAISLPPGTGKSTLAIFFICWLAGKEPDKCILTGSHSNAFIRGAYDECLRVMGSNDSEYLFSDVFPLSPVSNTNAKDCRIDLGKRKRFESLQFTSVGSGNAGLYRASKLLYCDDLIPSIEVALSKERLDKLWEQYTTDLRQRKIGDAVELHIATRWSVHDVIGRLESDYGDSDRAKFIVIPALDDNDESNFDYAYGVGFNTKFYHEQRNIMEDASWRALYMNQPIEREGLLYQEDELRRYFELPDGEPDAIISVCDTKDRGTDYCGMPIAYQYGQDFYIEQIICDNSNPEIVETRLVMALLEHKVHMSRFESNSAGGRVAQKVQENVKAKGGRTKITTKYTTANKETKIIVNSPWVKEHCLFKDNSVITDKEYKRALNFLCTYTMAGKNKNDDIPDAFAQLSEFAQSLEGNKVSVFKRPF